jgi:hypothetical protein
VYRCELGAWLRATVNELFSLPAGERPGRPVEREQVVDVEAHLTLVTAANTADRSGARLVAFAS